MIKKILNFKFLIRNCQAGMTYVELIVVLSIFAVISTVVVFDYNGFESKVDLKNLASDIALQIVQAQKSALSGQIPTQTPTTSPASAWKPSYGVFFNTNGTVNGADTKHFIYFTDLDNGKTYDNSTCSLVAAAGECLSQYTITKNNTISALKVYYTDSTPTVTLNDLTITFVRPDSGATLKSSTAFSQTNISYVEVTVHPPKGNDVYIRLYLPGRIEVDSL